MRLFCTVVEQGSFSQAAQVLFISQPALSIQIKRLQKNLGVPLLQATRGEGVVLTQAGRILYESAQVILEQERLTRQRLADIKSGTGGTLSVGVSPTGALHHVTDTIKRFRALRPNIEFHLHVELAETILARLLSGTVDVVVEWAPIHDDRLDVAPIGDVNFGVIIAPDHPLAREPVLSRDDFKRLPYLSMAGGLGMPGGVEAALVRAGILTAVSMRLPQTDSLLRAVEAGLGVSVVSTLTAEREVAAGRLKWMRLDGFQLTRPMVRVLARGRHQFPHVSAFIEALRVP